MTAEPLWEELKILQGLTEKIVIILEKKRDLVIELKKIESEEKSLELRKNMVLESIRIHKLLAKGM